MNPDVSKGSGLTTAVPVRLYPTPEQATLLRAHFQEYIRTGNTLVQALDSGVLPHNGQDATTKDFTLAFSRPGTPTDTTPSSRPASGRVREECLDQQWLHPREEARTC